MSFEPLTERELAILRLIAAGLSNREIGARLDLSPETIKWYNKRIYAKLDVSRRTQAVAYAQELGLLEAPSPPPAVGPDSTSPRPHNLPAQLTSFVGRQRELEIVSKLLENNRLLTLTGPGGTGKTRLALEVASRTLSHYPDGVTFVSLAPLDDPDLLLDTVAQAIDVKQQPGELLPDTLLRFLSGREALLILDNFEHLLPAAPHVGELLAAASTFSVLVTSRETLRLSGEQAYPVPPLDVKPVMKESAAVTLFAERARAVNPSFCIDEGNRRIVAAICALLSGLPLAIELAAARSRYFSPRGLLSRLQGTSGSRYTASALDLLSDGARDLPERQQTLRATIDWSYHLLAAEEQILFRRLAIFAGGCSTEAAAAICGVEEEQLTDLLLSLVDKNLLQVAEGVHVEPRFSMLHIIREYARERLQRIHEAQQMGERHARYYLALAEEAEPALTGPEQGTWLTRLETEHDNLRAALRSVLRNGEAELSLRLVSALWRFWLYRSHFHEGRQWLEEALELDGTAPRRLRARALHGMGELTHYQGDLAGAIAAHEQSLALRREAGDRGGMSDSLVMVGIIASELGDYDRATAVMEESLALARELNDPFRTAYALSGLAMCAVYQGRQPEARAMLEETLTLFRQQGDQAGIWSALNNLGLVEIYGGDYARAKQYLASSVELARQLDAPHFSAATRVNSALLALRTGRLGEAASGLIEGLQSFVEFGDRLRIAECLDGLAHVAAKQRRAERAAMLWGAAAALRDAFQAALPAVEQAAQVRAAATLRAHTPPERLERARDHGRRLAREDFEGLIAYAVEDKPEDTASSPSEPAPLQRLTPREREVLRLVAQGLSDAEVAQELVISPRTVNAHLTSIYSKLRVNSRTAATRLAVENGWI